MYIRTYMYVTYNYVVSWMMRSARILRVPCDLETLYWFRSVVCCTRMHGTTLYMYMHMHT